MQEKEHKLSSGLFGLLAMLLSVILVNGCSVHRVQTKIAYHPSVSDVKQARRSTKNIRVALIKNAGKVTIGGSSAIDVYDMATRRKLGTINGKRYKKWQMVNNHLMAGGHTFTEPEMRLVAGKSDYLSVNGRHYHGQITIIINKDRSMTVINILPLEDYVKGVVPNEVMAKWPMEALKAQAVIARTFAVYKMSGRKLKPYDLDATVNSQVYRGLDSEKESTNRAVDETKGMIASYNSKVIAAFYHSNCGGFTADVKNVWGSSIPYLKGRRCGYCDQGPHFKWSYKTSLDAVAKIARKHNYAVRQLTRIELGGRDESNRVKSIVLIDRQGKTIVKSSAFRMMAGADKIKSTNFYIEQNNGQIVFTGRGWGHGVGLCQEGAMGMAERGFDFQTIIKRYYPGVNIDLLEQDQ